MIPEFFCISSKSMLFPSNFFWKYRREVSKVTQSFPAAFCPMSSNSAEARNSKVSGYVTLEDISRAMGKEVKIVE